MKTIFFILISTIFSIEFAIASGTDVNKVYCTDNGGYDHYVSIGIYGDTANQDFRFAEIRLVSKTSSFDQSEQMTIEQTLREDEFKRVYEGPDFKLVAYNKETPSTFENELDQSTLLLKKQDKTLNMTCSFDLENLFQ